MTYTIWMCCGEFEQEDTREEAISLAAGLMNSDGHQVIAVEGPNGEDLLAEAEEKDRKRSDQWVEESRTRMQKYIGHIEVKGPTGKWWGRIGCFSTEFRDSEMAAMVKVYGAGRVRFVEEKPR